MLAANINALMAARPRLDTVKKVHAAGGPSTGTVDRIRRAEIGTSVDQLDQFAAVFELEPWQLLVPGLQPNNPPILQNRAGEVERALWARIDALMVENTGLRKHAEAAPGDFSI